MGLSSPSGRSLRAVSSILLALIGIIFALPMAWVVLASFDKTATFAMAWPAKPTLGNFTAVLTPDQAFLPLWNSLLISAGCAIVTVIAAILAAYPLSRYKARFNKRFLYGILFGTALPITAMMVPVYSLFVALKLIDSLPGTVLFMAATSLPTAIWMMKNFMDSVPIALEEAAWVDGASSMRALWSVVMPLMRPGIAVVFILVFVHAWGNFFVPFVLLLSPGYQPAAVSIFTFFGQYGAVVYGQLAAYSLIYSVPVLALYVLVYRVFGGTSALAGGVKG